MDVIIDGDFVLKNVLSLQPLFQDNIVLLTGYSGKYIDVVSIIIDISAKKPMLSSFDQAIRRGIYFLFLSNWVGT